ncbi:hypothetical protein BJV78DRAFT_1287145 [Lactifluus subvellereus]|nr:hypothetical protein BJV78DRAFT_1287145 [Lactifluus subvellereus]
MLFVLAPYPGTEIEGIPDEDAPEYPEMTEWNGESTFWGPHHELEFFDDKDAPERDEWPIEDIPDPEGEDLKVDDATAKGKRQFIFPPSQADAKQAFKDLTILLFPRQTKGHGLNSKKCELDKNTRERLEHVHSFLHLYVEREKSALEKAGNWKAAADDARKAAVRKPHYARLLKEWAQDFICDSQELPRINHGGGIKSLIDDEDIAQDIKIHL